jgi:hypothetical protein
VLMGMGFITQVLSSERAGGAWGWISAGFRKEEPGT